MIRIAIITGSTRPGRVSEQVARWAYDLAKQRTDAEFELVDIAAYDLPLLDEPASPKMNSYTHEHTKRWSEKIASFDGYVFVTPEYNHSMPAALKNALDYLFYEWNNRSAGFISYGVVGGARAVESLRPVVGELLMADVKEQVLLSIFTDFENYKVFKPAAMHEQSLTAMLDQVISWGKALRTVRLPQ